ncbi:MAG: hypothetical protein HN354_12600 [Deltaproteobacteria bacterium]|nr:hypothetical protein [Deltaproteobacteria bacterium]
MTTPNGRKALTLYLVSSPFEKTFLVTSLTTRKINRHKEGQKNSTPPFGENHIPTKKLS